MYNGIGLATPRGSGTNGFVQRNLSTPRTKFDRKDAEKEMAKFEASKARKPNKELLEHEMKRMIEVKVMELQDRLEEKGLSEDQIEEQVTALRIMLTQKSQDGGADSGLAPSNSGGDSSYSKAIAAERRNAMAKSALGIEENYVDGSSFNEEIQAQRKQQRIEKRDEERKKREEERARKQAEYEENRKRREAEREAELKEIEKGRMEREERRKAAAVAAAAAAAAVVGKDIAPESSTLGESLKSGEGDAKEKEKLVDGKLSDESGNSLGQKRLHGSGDPGEEYLATDQNNANDSAKKSRMEIERVQSTSSLSEKAGNGNVNNEKRLSDRDRRRGRSPVRRTRRSRSSSSSSRSSSSSSSSHSRSRSRSRSSDSRSSSSSNSSSSSRSNSSSSRSSSSSSSSSNSRSRRRNRSHGTTKSSSRYGRKESNRSRSRSPESSRKSRR